MRKGYQCESQKFYGCYDGGTRMVWKITTPSGQKYEVSKSSRSHVCIETRYKVVAIVANYNEAVQQIYAWEKDGISFEPDLTDKNVVINIIQRDMYCNYTRLLIEDGIIIPNLQTAVYLFNNRFADIPGMRRNLNWMHTILSSLNLNDEELLIFCRYAISRDPMCAGSIPSDFLARMTVAGRSGEIFTPIVDEIDTNWLKSPCFA